MHVVTVLGLIWLLGIVALSIWAAFHSSKYDDVPLSITIIMIAIWPVILIYGLLGRIKNFVIGDVK